jgi:hypothetical protein
MTILPGPRWAVDGPIGLNVAGMRPPSVPVRKHTESSQSSLLSNTEAGHLAGFGSRPRAPGRCRALLQFEVGALNDVIDEFHVKPPACSGLLWCLPVVDELAARCVITQ